MVRRLAKMVAYAKAPRSTFAVLHPIRALKLGAVVFLGRKLLDGLTPHEERGRRHHTHRRR